MDTYAIAVNGKGGFVVKITDNGKTVIQEGFENVASARTWINDREAARPKMPALLF